MIEIIGEPYTKKHRELKAELERSFIEHLMLNPDDSYLGTKLDFIFDRLAALELALLIKDNGFNLGIMAINSSKQM
jgi:hypothetical protein